MERRIHCGEEILIGILGVRDINAPLRFEFQWCLIFLLSDAVLMILAKFFVIYILIIRMVIGLMIANGEVRLGVRNWVRYARYSQ